MISEQRVLCLQSLFIIFTTCTKLEFKLELGFKPSLVSVPAASSQFLLVSDHSASCSLTAGFSCVSFLRLLLHINSF